MNHQEQKGSVSIAIEGSKQGHAEAQDILYARYFQRLAQAAVPTLGRIRGGLRDEYKAASSTLRDYLKKAEAGSLPNIEDRTALLAYLMAVVKSKAKDQVRSYLAGKRREDLVSEETVLLPSSEADVETAMDWAEARDVSQDDLLLFQEVMERVKAVLTDREYQLLLMDLDDYSNAQMAESLQVSATLVKKSRVTALAKLAKEFQVGLNVIREALRKQNSKHF